MDELNDKVKASLDKLFKTAPDKWTATICAGTLIDRKTGVYSAGFLNGTVCHSWLPYNRWGDEGDNADQRLVFNTTKNIESDAERAFAKWVAQDSPFSYGVLNRDNLDQIYHGGMVIDMKLVGCGGALWLCKAMRYIYESKGRVAMFGRLVALGVPPKAAFFACSSYGNYHGSMGNCSRYGDATVSNLSSYCDHNQVQANITKEMFVKAYKVEKAPAYHGGTTAQALLGKSLAGCNENWLGFGKSKTERVSDGWGGYIEKQVPADETKSAQELIAFLKEEGLMK